jgi:hypothetical protein
MSIDTYTSKLTSRTSVSPTLPPSCMFTQLFTDRADDSFADTKKSARELARDDLIKVLTYKSGDAVNWLVERFNLDLSKVSRLGGHSEKRTHRGGAQFPGMTITYALMEKVSPGLFFLSPITIQSCSVLINSSRTLQRASPIESRYSRRRMSRRSSRMVKRLLV